MFFHVAYIHKTLSQEIPEKISIEEVAQLKAKEMKKSTENKAGIEDEKEYKCFKCKHQFSRYIKLLAHISIIHFKEKLLQKHQKGENVCNICNRAFSDQKNLLIHLTHQHDVLKDLIPAISELKNEKKKGKPSSRKCCKCSVCDFEVGNAGKLMRHIASVHFRDVLQEKYILDGNKCSLCNYTTKYISDLFGHLASNHQVLKDLLPTKIVLQTRNDNPKKLEIEDTVDFKIETETNNDVSAETNQVQHQSEGKTEFKQTIPSSKTYQCHLCVINNPKFSTILQHLANTHFKDRLRATFGSSSDTCSKCSMRFNKEHSLMLHYASKHEGLKDLIPSKEDLQTDSSVHLNQKEISSDPSISYKCHLCEFVQPGDNYLKVLKHIALKHYKEDLYGMFGSGVDRCTRCGLQFSHENQLMVHYIYKHDALKEILPEKKDLRVVVDPTTTTTKVDETPTKVGQSETKAQEEKEKHSGNNFLLFQ
jgi:hypothetical protein